MHFEILVEDQSGKIALESIMPKILGPNGQVHTYRIFAYRGIGRVPKNLRGRVDPQKRILLDRLPKLLRGYGKSLQNISAAVIVVVDLDQRDCLLFKQELIQVWLNCDPRPAVLFRIAIEEMEAWLLGDRNAVKSAYPRAKNSILDSYDQDSICGTWEKLADAVYDGGAQALKKLDYQQVGKTKCKWANEISPLLTIDDNLSESFNIFLDGVRKIANNE